MKVILMVLAMALPAAAQSLLEQGGAQNAGSSPYDPPKRPPYKKHDLIQISVVERSKATSDSDLKTDRRSRTEIEFNKFINLETRGKNILLPRVFASDIADDPGINIDARYRQDNAGRTTRNFDLTVTVTAEIVDVRPNGNLVIMAKKRRKVNDDVETVKLTGEVSPSMIVNNTVKSDAIANLDVSYEGSGSASDPANKPGWLSKLINALWPF